MPRFPLKKTCISLRDTAFRGQGPRGIALLLFAILLLTVPAEAQEIASPRLNALRQELASGGPAAVERFWQAVAEEGTPWMEPAPGSPKETLVTFFWRGGDEVRNVVVVAFPGDLITEESLAAARMSRLPGTDLWFQTRRMRSDLRFDYSFSVNDSLIPLEKATTDEEEARWAALKPDPLNPHKVPDPSASLAELPDAPRQPWIEARPGVPAGRVEESTFHSGKLGNDRTIRVYTPPGYDAKGRPYSLLVVLDGRTYSSDIPTPTILDNLLAAGRIVPVVAVFVANPSAEARVREMSGHPPFAELLAGELIPWVRKGYRVTSDPARTALAGSSRGGLAAAFTAWKHPEVFGNVISLSGSFHWNPPGDAEPEWLARRIAAGPKPPLRFYMEVGVLEDRPRPDAPSLLASNRHLRTVLQAKGVPVEYKEFAGGHSILNWRGSIADGIQALFSAAPRPPR